MFVPLVGITTLIGWVPPVTDSPLLLAGGTVTTMGVDPDSSEPVDDDADDWTALDSEEDAEDCTKIEPAIEDAVPMALLPLIALPVVVSRNEVGVPATDDTDGDVWIDAPLFAGMDCITNIVVPALIEGADEVCTS